jgi:membrane protein YdbS with pleckstrin-like domain
MWHGDTRVGRWGRFLIRAAVALVLAAGLMFVPWVLPVPPLWAYTVVPVTVFGVIVYLGKLLYDTLFYNHYWP